MDDDRVWWQTMCDVGAMLCQGGAGNHEDQWECGARFRCMPSSTVAQSSSREEHGPRSTR